MVLRKRPEGRRAALALKTAATLSVATMALAGTPNTAAAERGFQDPTPRAPTPGTSGWVGLQVDFVASSAKRARSGTYTVVISEVVPRSPAAEAGVQPGDTLLEMNGVEASPASFDELRSDLRSGDVIRLAVLRDRVERDIEVVAASRPAFVFGPNPPELEGRIDSLRTAILRKADSLRQQTSVRSGRIAIRSFNTSVDSFVTVLEIETDDGHHVRRTEGASVAVVTGGVNDPSAMSWSFQVEEPGTPQAFETRVVQTPRTDSLRVSIVRLQSELERVQRAQMRVAQELSATQTMRTTSTTPSSEQRDQVSVAKLTELRALQGLIASRLVEKERELRSESRAELEAARASASTHEHQAPRVQVRIRESSSVPRVQPITPYLVGKSYLAGARVTEMNEGLSEYFGVSEGVLVTEVADEAPAARSGIEAGDVIVRVDDQAVHSVNELRARLASRWTGASLLIVRKGTRVSLELSR